MLRTVVQHTPELNLLHTFEGAIESFSTFVPEHVRCADCVRRLFDELASLQAARKGDVSIRRIENGFAVNESCLVARDYGLVQLEERFQSMGLVRLDLTPGVTRDELRVLFQIVIHKLKEGTLVSLEREAMKAGLTHITITTSSRAGGDAPAAARGANGTDPQEIWAMAQHPDETLYWRAIERTRTLCTTIRIGHIPNAYGVRDAVESFLAPLRANRDALLPMVFMPQDGDWELSHSVRCAILAMRLGVELTDDDTSLRLLGESAFLHDIGLFAIPVQVLHKHGPLTDDERALIRQHTIEGVKMLLTGSDFPPAAVEAALLHHSAQPSDGYPELSETTALSTVAKIIKVVDAYESIIGVRPYRRARSPVEGAAELIRGADTSFDGAIVGRFIRTIGFFPIGSAVRLSDGSIAQVLKHDSARMHTPSVAVLLDGAGRLVNPPREIEIGAARQPIAIVEGLPCEPEVLRAAC